jgi:hypothetical protein
LKFFKKNTERLEKSLRLGKGTEFGNIGWEARGMNSFASALLHLTCLGLEALFDKTP